MYVHRKVVKIVSQYDKVYEYRNDKGDKITNHATIEYIKSLKIPPAYENVKINLDRNSKLLVTGYDVKGKKQYLYNPIWVEMRSIKKFCNMIDFGNKLPKIEKDIHKLLELRGYPKEKLVAIIIKIITLCHFRIGNSIGKDVYESYGVSTLNKSHFTPSSNMKSFTIDFRGKKGVQNKCTLKDRQLIEILSDLKNRAKNKNEQIFFYIEDGKRYPINSCDVNNFLKTYGNFTTKDFRTWHANIYFIEEMAKVGTISENITDRKRVVRENIQYVAEKLHHTVAISKKKYINPDLINMYIEDPRKFDKIVLKHYNAHNKNNRKADNAFIWYLLSVCKNQINNFKKNNMTNRLK
jgi:DNA topoisomerase-1